MPSLCAPRIVVTARAWSSAPRSRPAPAAELVARRAAPLGAPRVDSSNRGKNVRPLQTAFDPSYLDNYAQDLSATFQEREDRILRENEEKWAEMQTIADSVVAAADCRDEAKIDEIVAEADEVWEYLSSSTDISDTSTYLFFKTVSACLDNWVAPEFHNLSGRTASITQGMLDRLRAVAWPLLNPRAPEEVELARHAAGVTLLVIDAVRAAGEDGDPDFGPVLAALRGGMAPEAEGQQVANFLMAVEALLQDGKLTPDSRLLTGVHQEGLDGIVSYMQSEGFEIVDSDDIPFV